MFKDKKYATIKGNYLYPCKETLVQDNNEVKDMIEGKVQNHYVKLYSDILKVNISTNPNSSRRVGNLAEIEWQSENRTINTNNITLSGFYLIRNIRHCIFNGVYQPVLTMISDGVQQSKNDLISW